MISMDGAALIATVIPVALLVVGFEIQRAPTLYGATRGGTVGLWVIGVILVLGLTLGFVAERHCLVAVATHTPLNVVESVVTWLALYLLGIGAFLLLMASLLDRLGVLDKLGERHSRRVTASPRRWERQRTYIRDHHPSARDLED